MKNTLVRWSLVLAILVIDLLPCALILKQAVTPESESFSWPPTWLPREVTVENFRNLAATSELGSGIGLSIFVALLTMLSTLALTLPAAWLAARSSGAEGRFRILMTVSRLFPTIALAVPLAALFVSVGLYNNSAGLGLWLAHTLLAIPVAFFVMQTAFREVPPELEEAARLDGASGFTTFWRITLPAVRPALGAAGILVFLTSWDEFGYAILLQVTNRPLPPLVYYFAAFGYPGLASAVATIMIIPAIAVISILAPALRSGALTGIGR